MFVKGKSEKSSPLRPFLHKSCESIAFVGDGPFDNGIERGLEGGSHIGSLCDSARHDRVAVDGELCNREGLVGREDVVEHPLELVCEFRARVAVRSLGERVGALEVAQRSKQLGVAVHAPQCALYLFRRGGYRIVMDAHKLEHVLLKRRGKGQSCHNAACDEAAHACMPVEMPDVSLLEERGGLPDVVEQGRPAHERFGSGVLDDPGRVFENIIYMVRVFWSKSFMAVSSGRTAASTSTVPMRAS